MPIIIITLAVLLFSGCASIPEFHTYSQGISDWNYSKDVMVSKFSGHQNSDETMIKYSRIHAYEVCYDKGFDYVWLTETKISPKSVYNPWAERMYYVSDYAETAFFCSNKPKPEYETTEWGARQAAMFRETSTNEEQRRVELKIQNGVVTWVSVLVSIFAIAGIIVAAE